jgi:hypothetical protein
MPDFESFVARHGEPVTQALIETIERHSGARVRFGLPLEQRWHDAMAGALPQDNAVKAGERP